MYSPIRAIACLASGSSSAKIGNMWIISSQSSIETSQPAALARSAHRVESSRSVSQVPTRISVGGSPRRSAYSGDASGALRSPRPRRTGERKPCCSPTGQVDRASRGYASSPLHGQGQSEATCIPQPREAPRPDRGARSSRPTRVRRLQNLRQIRSVSRVNTSNRRCWED
jgi:hypothetical protein